jgi:hypothetical protein
MSIYDHEEYPDDYEGERFCEICSIITGAGGYYGDHNNCVLDRDLRGTIRELCIQIQNIKEKGEKK